MIDMEALDRFIDGVVEKRIERKELYFEKQKIEKRLEAINCRLTEISGDQMFMDDDITDALEEEVTRRLERRSS